MKFIKPRQVFLVYILAVVAFLAAATTQRYAAGIAMLYLTLFFESVIFPTIIALGIRGLGKHYKRGSGFLVGGVCGGAVVPPILGHVADTHDSTGFAMIIPTMFVVVAATYAVAVNVVSAYRETVDRTKDSDIGLRNEGKHVESGSVEAVELVDDKPAVVHQEK